MLKLVRFESTYEELKPDGRVSNEAGLTCFESTYEELKLFIFSITLTNISSFESTYEELKHNQTYQLLYLT